MLNETRVNLRHLLEDIRDSYSSPLEEVIITELIANALDSKAFKIEFTINPELKFLRCLDNGQGMKRPQLREYHNIAATTKMRGQGIGFAGVGAKLALLLAEKVITESKGGYGSRAATEWRLTNPYRAPWKFIPTSDAVPTSRGTAITLFCSDNKIHLLKPDFVRQTIIKHFYSLLADHLNEEILRYVYKKRVEFVVNGELLVLPETEQRFDKFFKVYLGKSRRPIGAGFLRKKVLEQNWLQKFTGQEPQESSLPTGLSISTFGKTIKGGWEWLGILPKNYESLVGLVEIPALSVLLTTNKNNFLSDALHLKQYYRFRKAIQQAILPVLQELGEYTERDKKPVDKNIKTITRQIENALVKVTGKFPELLPLLGNKKKVKDNEGSVLEKVDNLLKRETNAKLETKKGKQESKKSETDKKTDIHFKKTGLQVVLEEFKDEPEKLGRMIDDVVYINTLHSAWQKSLQQNLEEYHIVLTTGLVLSEFLDPEKHPQEFLSLLLNSWGQLENKNSNPKLFS